MTVMNVCILEATDTLYCRDLHYSYIDKFIVNLKPEMETAQDLFDGVNRARYPRNLDYHERRVPGIGAKRVKRRPQTPQDFDFFQRAGPAIKYMSRNDITQREAWEGMVLLDLKNKKVIHLDYRSPMGQLYPSSTLTMNKDDNDPNARRKYDECREGGGGHYDCYNEAFKINARFPRGYERITITLEDDPEPGSSTLRPEALLIKMLRNCNQESGEFYRTLGGCDLSSF